MLIRTVLSSWALLTGLLLAGPAHALLIDATSQAFSEPDGGASSPGFSGTLFVELFDSGGGGSALAGGSVAATGGDFTLLFQIAMDADVDIPTAIDMVGMSAFQLGAGDGCLQLLFDLSLCSPLSPGPTSGGVFGGGGDPSFSTGSDGQFANFSFGGGGLAEGATSPVFFFTIADVVTGPSGSTQVPLGDQMTVSFTSINANSVDVQLTLSAPEPGTGLLLLLGVLGLAALRRSARSSGRSPRACSAEPDRGRSVAARGVVAAGGA